MTQIKIRGKAGELIFFEEAGSFAGLLKAWEVAMPTMRQGSKTLGTMVAFGTGGEEGPGFEVWKNCSTTLKLMTVYHLRMTGCWSHGYTLWLFCPYLQKFRWIY